MTEEEPCGSNTREKQKSNLLETHGDSFSNYNSAEEAEMSFMSGEIERNKCHSCETLVEKRARIIRWL